MAYGTANVDVVQSSTAGAPPQFNDGNGIQVGTLCRAWVNFNGTSGSVAVRASFNVSSITRNGTGDYTINFTTALSDVNYAAVVNGCNATATGTGAFGPYNAAPSTSSYRFGAVNLSGVTQPLADMAYSSVAIFR